MKRIVVFGASNSRQSINHQLAMYAASLVINVEIIPLEIHQYEMPLFGVDRYREEGLPELALKFHAQIYKADGLIISFAEHNGTYSVGFKNIFDWISQIKGELWEQKPLLAMATSPGKRGGKSILQLAISRIEYLGGRVVASFSLPSFYENFNPTKGIVDIELKNNFEIELNKFLLSL